MTTKKKTANQTNQARGNSRAAQNKKIRRDAVRESLKSQQLVKFLLLIAEGKDPHSKRAYKINPAQKIKLKTDIYFQLLNKCLPSLKPVDLPVSFELPKIKSADDALKVMGGIMKNVSDGVLTISQGKEYSSIVENYIKTLEVVELESRLELIEKKVFNNG